MSTVETPGPNARTVTAGPLLEARGVVKRFGETEALRGVDFAIAPGEIVAVMGPSGSGKSTLLHCLAGVLVPDEGEVTAVGVRLDQLDEEARSAMRRKFFGFVFQFGQLLPELSAAENIALPLLLAGHGRADALAAAEPWFGRLGLDGCEERRPGQLSGGQSQRVAVARAMVSGPAVLFADEPTGSLDSLAGDTVMRILSATAREGGTAVVLVTHEPRVGAYADRVVIVRDGRLSAG
jgi:putative ABC transport system ATP-binding protein